LEDDRIHVTDVAVRSERAALFWPIYLANPDKRAQSPLLPGGTRGIGHPVWQKNGAVAQI